MLDTSVVIATRNLIRAGRGWDRVRWQVLTWLRQKGGDPEIIVSDGSKPAEHRALCKVLPPEVVVLWDEQPELNLCKLWNAGIRQATGKYIQISGSDFVYRSDYLEQIRAIRNPRRFIMAHTLDARKTTRRYGDHSVLRWEWAHGARPNRWGNLANGIQHATRAFFMAHPFSEEMRSLGAQDNLMYYKAKAAGMECGWLPHGPVVHLWHKFSPEKQAATFEANQRILSAYITENGLSADLKQSQPFEHVPAS